MSIALESRLSRKPRETNDDSPELRRGLVIGLSDLTASSIIFLSVAKQLPFRQHILQEFNDCSSDYQSPGQERCLKTEACRRARKGNWANARVFCPRS